VADADGEAGKQLDVIDPRVYPRFSETEIHRRWRAVQMLLTQHDLAAAIVFGTGRFNREIHYLTDWPGGTEGYLFVPAAGNPVLLVQLYNHVPMARRLSRIADTRWGGPRSFETVADLSRQHGVTSSRIGLIGPIPYQHYEHWQSALPGADWVDLTGAFRDLMTVKSPEELQRIRRACELTDKSMEALEQSLRPGVREIDLPALIEPVYLNAGGYAGIHFFAAVSMDDPDVCVPAQYPSERVIHKGDAVITEISGAFWGYSGQIHRTYFIGSPPRDDWRALHDVALEAFLAIEGVLKDGATVADVLAAAERIHQQGYQIYDDLLHGLNQLPPIVRTRPTMNRAPEDYRFRQNMVVVIQPNVITADQKKGLQFGETVRITRTGTERLHRYPRTPILCAA
jgi:Xaa-Pro aminopeptidase